MINFVDRQFISSFAPFLKSDLGLSDTEIGLLTGIVFIFFYTVAGLFVGTLADRYNRTKIIGIGVILWSAFTAISGFAKISLPWQHQGFLLVLENQRLPLPQCQFYPIGMSKKD